MKNEHKVGFDRSKCLSNEVMMDCLAGELEFHDRQAVLKHVESCPACNALYTDLLATARWLDEARPSQESRDDLVARIMASLPADDGDFENEPDAPFSLFLRIAAGFILVSVLLVGLVKEPGQSTGIAKRGAAVPHAEFSTTMDRSIALTDTLKWLAKVQEPSGQWHAASWGGRQEYACGLNGLALMAFVRSGKIAGEYAGVIKRSTEYLMGCQKGTGLFGEESEGMMYNHGIVSVALLEAYAATGNQALKPSIDKALGFIRKQQLATGGWGYVNRPGETANTSVAAWQLHAMILAAKLGWDDSTFSLKKGLLWFGSMIDDGGQLGYDRPGRMQEDNATLTAIGAFCMFSASDVEKMPDGKLLLQLRRSLDSLKNEFAGGDYYRSYFRAAALQAGKDGQQDRKLLELQNSLLTMQERTGGNAGSWSPNDRWGSVGGRIYSTAVAGLTLGLTGNPVNRQ